MSLNRLDNFLKSVRGTVIHVNPDSLDATDSIDNQGNSSGRPFITLQRALIEAARFSYQRGLNNDRFDKTTILLYPYEHIVDNRPGWIPNWTEGESPSYILRNGTRSNKFAPLDFTSNFDLNSEDNILYKFNSIHGGIIVPRGVSIVGMDLRKTKIRPKYVPNPENDNIERSCIFRLTGGCYLWKFSIFDANPNGSVFKDHGNNVFLPNFSHHKLTAFEYADGVNPVNINDAYLTYSTDKTDLDLYYKKIGIGYGGASGREIQPDYPLDPIDIQTKIDEYQIVGSRGIEVGITSIKAGNGILPTNIITVDIVNPVPGLQVDTPIQINGVNVAGYSGQYVVSEVVSPTSIKYRSQLIPTDPLPDSEDILNANLNVVSDTVTGASPYIFNISLRSVYGMCGLHADGNKSSGFKSMVVAQFTGIGLQKDDKAFVLYNPQTGLFEDSISRSNLYSNSKSRFKPSYENYHIKASNNAFVQIVSVFAIGYANHFISESGGDLSITNSNSNFGAKSLVSKGFRDTSFEKDDIGYITHIIPPKEIENQEISVEFESIDITKTKLVNNSNRLYLSDETNLNIKPQSVIDGYRIGAKKDDLLNLTIFSGDTFTNYSAPIVMQGTQQISFEKSYNVAKKPNGLSNQINGNSTLVLTQSHDFINGESVRVISDNGQLPDGLINNQIYYVINNSSSPGLGSTEIKLAKTLNDALNGSQSSSAISVYNNGQSNLKIVSRVSDKKSGDIGHPIQYDPIQQQWYILVKSSNDIFTKVQTLTNQSTQRTFIKRILDNRNVSDKIYKARYVIPKDSSIFARPPSDGFIIQESGNPSLITSEIEKVDSITTKTLTNSTELRNYRFISSATWVNQIATITTEIPHDLSVGNQVEIKNIKSSLNLNSEYNLGYNGKFNVVNVAGRRQFTIEIPVNPGEFLNNTSLRNSSLPYFRRVLYKDTYAVYQSEEIQTYVNGEQDGIYHLLLINFSYSPNATPFNELRFSQPVQNLFPQTNRDNIVSDPKPAICYSLPDPIGQVVINNPENSLTKETTVKLLNDLNVGVGLTNIVSNIVGTSHTFYTRIDHGLNRIAKVEIINAGFGYGNGISGTLYNARLVGTSGTITGDGATATVSFNSNGQLNGIKIVDGGSAYNNGNTLNVVGIATTTNHIPAIIRVTNIYNNVGNVLELSGIQSETLEKYNGIYRITGIQTGNTKQIQVSSSSSISSPSTTGLGITIAQNSKIVVVGESILPTNFTYNNVIGIGTITTNRSHGLSVGNKVRISGADDSFYNKEFIISKVNSQLSFELNIGKNTSTPSTAGTIFVLRTGYTSNGGNLFVDDENISGRFLPQYAGITTTLLFAINDVNLTSINITNVQNLDFNIGDYIQIDNEIMRIKQTVTNNPVSVFRGVLGTRRTGHSADSIIRKISIKPIEFRRNSIIRASGHTFEYVGYGPGNYSTSLPEKQDRKLSPQEELLSQATKVDGGLTVFTGMNDAGDFYIGNKTINSSTGKEEVFNTPIPLVTGEELNVDYGFDIINPLEVSVTRSINVEGGTDNNITSKFNGPVIFNNKITSNSTKGIEANSIFLQGDADISRKITVGISTPAYIGNPGDSVFKANPSSTGYVGWVFAEDNAWHQYGPIKDNVTNSYIGVWKGNFIGDGSGLSNVSDIWISTASGISTTKSIGINTSAAKSGISLYVQGYSEFNGNSTFVGIVTFNNKATFENDVNINKKLTVGEDFSVTGISTLNDTVYVNDIAGIGTNITFIEDVQFDENVRISKNLYVGDDMYVRNQSFRSIVSNYAIVFGL